MRIGYRQPHVTYFRAKMFPAKVTPSRRFRCALAEVPPAPAPQLSMAHLTNRESEVLLHIAEGGQNKDIATTLGIEVDTVETHRERLMKKTNLHSVGALVHLALQKGMEIKPNNFDSLPKFARADFEAEVVNVLILLAIGKSTKEIAAILNAEDRHIGDVRGKLKKKTNRPNTALLAQLAIEMGLVQLGVLKVPKDLAA